MATPKSVNQQLEEGRKEATIDTLRRMVSSFDVLLSLLDTLPRHEQVHTTGLMLARLADKLKALAKIEDGRPEMEQAPSSICQLPSPKT